MESLLSPPLRFQSLSFSLFPFSTCPLCCLLDMLECSVLVNISPCWMMKGDWNEFIVPFYTKNKECVVDGRPQGKSYNSK
jgi:hypothetical protein